MKYLLMILSLVILVSSCTIDYAKVATIGNECYYKEDMSPVNGKVIRYNSHNLKVFEAHYKDGKLDGLRRKWYKNGQLEEEYNCKNGIRDGYYRMWYGNGQIKSEINYKNGKVIGIKSRWYKNGQLQNQYNFKEGKLSGVQREWDKKGILRKYPREQLLKDFIATTIEFNYDYYNVMKRFPELQDIDSTILINYATSVVNSNYNYSQINPKYPQLFK